MDGLGFQSGAEGFDEVRASGLDRLGGQGTSGCEVLPGPRLEEAYELRLGAERLEKGRWREARVHFGSIGSRTR
ncbi:MAG: hypothetical protein RLZ45_3106 [Verrucomicrobiota bacterium]